MRAHRCKVNESLRCRVVKLKPHEIIIANEVDRVFFRISKIDNGSFFQSLEIPTAKQINLFKDT